MACNNEDKLDINDELSKIHLSLYENVIELWRIEEKCRLKLKNIEEINNSTALITEENEGQEKQLIDIKAKMKEVRDEILSMENVIFCLYETLAYLEVQQKEKEFSVFKSKSENELQLFIRMELWQKEEERLNNIPEIKTLKIADLELKNTKSEYENLLIDQENLVKQISIAEKENSKKLNDVIVRFAKIFIEMYSINEREKQCRIKLRKLDAEYQEKFNMKNALLESQKNKINKVSFWTHSLFPFDSKHNLLNSNNNSQDFPYQHQFDGKHSKLCNEPKQIECSEKSSLTINDLISHSEMNGNIDQCSKNVVVDLGEKCVDDNNKKLDILDVVTNKRKPIKEQLDFEFKKPYNPFHGINYGSTNSNISKVQPNSTNKENNLIENQEKVESLKSPVKTIQDNLNDNKQLHLMYSMKSAKQSDSINLNSDKIIMFDDILLQLESTSNEENKTSGLYWNNCNVPVSENSGNYSFCGSDLSELFGNVYDFSQFAEMKLNFMNSLDSDSNTPNDTDFQKLKNNITQKSIDVMFHNHENESFKKINNENCMSMNTSTANESNDLIQSTKLNFESTESFMFNFN